MKVKNWTIFRFSYLKRTAETKFYQKNSFLVVVTAIHHSTSHLINIFIQQNLKYICDAIQIIFIFPIIDYLFNVLLLQDKKVFFRLIEKYFSASVNMKFQKMKIFYQDLTGVWFIFFGPTHLLYVLIKCRIWMKNNSDISEKLQ